MMGFDSMAIFFWLFAVVACAGALIVVVSRNIVRAAVGLIVSLFGVAMLFFLAGAEFLGAMQLMVYVGGTVVLLAFGVMLTARALFLRMSTTADQWLVAILLVFPLTVILIRAALSYSPSHSGRSFIDHPADKSSAALVQPVTVSELGMALLGFRENGRSSESTTLFHGNQGYLLPFELISVHLLVVLIGAAYLARRGVPETRASADSKSVSDQDIGSTD
jgi:NADH:ubiquinone oxidoreductase subunit 6 (subunit J)